MGKINGGLECEFKTGPCLNLRRPNFDTGLRGKMRAVRKLRH